MNAARLRELAELLIATEDRFKLQDILQQLVVGLDQLMGNPAHPPAQTQFANDFTKFRGAWTQMAASFSPAQAKLVEEIKAAPYFLNDLPTEFDELAKANNITPAVVRESVEKLRREREKYLARITDLRDRLGFVGIDTYKLEPGSAEIGLLLPRDMFDNELGGLIKELRTLNRIIRAFSEIAVGKPERVEVHQISTSDPVFFFGLAPETIALLAGAVTWAIATWKQVEDIRKVRAETQKISSFTPEEVEEIFGSKIQKEIAVAVDKKVEELIPVADGAGRVHEQRNDMKWALESILSRVERGLTVEVRFLPPPVKEGETESTDKIAFDTLAEITPQLKFPAPDSVPVLSLPAPEPPSDRVPAASRLLAE